MAPISILIVGCGVAGPALATFLLLSSQAPQDLPHITILERSSSLSAKGQNVDIRGAGVTVIRKLGLEQTIKSSTTGEEGVQFVDVKNRVWGAFEADKSGKVQTGTSDIEILRGRLAEILYHRSQDVSLDVRKQGGAGIEYVFGDYLDELHQDNDKVHVRFAKSNDSRSYDLVVGADGLLSRTRNLAFGAEREEQRLKRLGLYAGFFSMPKGQTNSSWRRWYHAPERRSIMVRPSHDKGTSTVLIGVVKDDEDQRLIDVGKMGHKGVDAQKDLLSEYFQDAGWESKRIIKEMYAADDFYYDMVAQVKMDKWSKGRVVLLADAGYCASPISGMGTTLALVGGYNLAGALTRIQTTTTPPSPTTRRR
ncbi:hypothetical protein AAFC00_004439 [Neodothiora populina]|uniref:FAD-binding domain-containing protein n=1 Tax=Neodothiora populina TaxID=2781224 RepID=A0ABR3P258_9PEZI